MMLSKLSQNVLYLVTLVHFSRYIFNLVLVLCHCYLTICKLLFSCCELFSEDDSLLGAIKRVMLSVNVLPSDDKLSLHARVQAMYSVDNPVTYAFISPRTCTIWSIINSSSKTSASILVTSIRLNTPVKGLQLCCLLLQLCANSPQTNFDLVSYLFLQLSRSFINHSCDSTLISLASCSLMTVDNEITIFEKITAIVCTELAGYLSWCLFSPGTKESMLQTTTHPTLGTLHTCTYTHNYLATKST